MPLRTSRQAPEREAMASRRKKRKRKSNAPPGYAGRGRPPNLLREQTNIRKFLGYLRAGNFRESAAKAVGWWPASVSMWFQRGRRAIVDAAERVDGIVVLKPEKIPQKERPFAEFFESVTRAEQEAEVRMVNILSRAAGGYVDEWTTRTPEGELVVHQGRRIEPDWRAAVTWLRTKFPDRWNKKPRAPDAEGGSRSAEQDAEEVSKLMARFVHEIDQSIPIEPSDDPDQPDDPPEDVWEPPEAEVA